MHTPEAEIPASPIPMRYKTKTTAHSLNAVCVSAGMPNHMILFLFVPPNRKLIQCTKSSTYCRLSSVAFQNYLILLASSQMHASQVVVAKSQAARIESEDDPYNSIRSPPTIRCHSLTTKTKTFFLASCWHSLCNCARRQEAG